MTEISFVVKSDKAISPEQYIDVLEVGCEKLRIDAFHLQKHRKGLESDTNLN